MVKKQHIAAALAAATLVVSSAASAGGFATWPNRHGPGRNFAYWGPHGARVGHWAPGAAGWYPGKYGGWWPGKYAGTGAYYGYPRYDDYYYGDRHHDNDNLLWYGLGVATPLLLRSLNNYDHGYSYDRY